jgi:hypothetical protein
LRGGWWRRVVVVRPHAELHAQGCFPLGCHA